MKVIIQRVIEAAVSIDENVVERIGAGYMILAGIREGDTEKETCRWQRK